MWSEVWRPSEQLPAFDFRIRFFYCELYINQAVVIFKNCVQRNIGTDEHLPLFGLFFSFCVNLRRSPKRLFGTGCYCHHQKTNQKQALALHLFLFLGLCTVPIGLALFIFRYIVTGTTSSVMCLVSKNPGQE